MKGFKWNTRHVELGEGGDAAGLTVLGPLFLMMLTFIFVLWSSMFFVLLYPKKLEFRETFVTLYLISAVFIITSCVSCGVFSSRNSKIFWLPVGLLLLLESFAYFYFILALFPAVKLLWETKTLKNLDDANVDLLKTFYLAIYHECCFDAVEDFPPPLDCESKNNIQPCYSDEELFQDLLRDMSFQNDKCYRISGFDLTRRIEGEARPSTGFCPGGDKNFVRDVGRRAHRLMLATAGFAFSTGVFCLWSSSEFVLSVVSMM